MLKVRVIMTPSAVSRSAKQTLRDAVEVLVSCRIGGGPVVEGDTVIGVRSADDIIAFESVTPLEGRDLAEADEARDAQVDDDREAWSEGSLLSSSYFTGWLPNDGPDVAERIASSRGPQWD